MKSHIHPTTRPTVALLLQHKVITAATHYQRMKNNSSLDATPWAHRAESDSRNRPFENWNGAPRCQRWDNSPFPKSISEIGASSQKDKQLQEPKSDKLLHEGSYASAVLSCGGIACFFLQFSGGFVKSENSVFHLGNVTYMTCHISVTQLWFGTGVESGKILSSFTDLVGRTKFKKKT